MRMRSVVIATTMAFGLVGSAGVLAASAGNSAGSINQSRTASVAGNSTGSINQSRTASVAGNSAGSINYAFGDDATPAMPEESGPCPVPLPPVPPAPAPAVPTTAKKAPVKAKSATTKPVVRKPVVRNPSVTESAFRAMGAGKTNARTAAVWRAFAPKA